MIKNNFHYISVLLSMLYGIELEDEKLEELGLIAWGLIGNKDIRLYRYSTNLDCDNSVTLPCNALEEGCVELVTASYEDWERVTNKHELGNFDSSFVENTIESEKLYQSPWYLPGKILKYHQVKDKLYFTHNYGRINILYKGILVDEEGLPEITDKEATAISTYIAYILKFKEGLITNNSAITNQANALYQLWTKQCDQARITYINQNDMNQILEIANSWDRPRYNKSTKIIK